MIPDQNPDVPAIFPATAMPDRDWWQALWPDPDGLLSGLLRGLDVRPGMTAIDLCCGDGWFTTALSRLIRDGRVIAIDLSQDLLAQARVLVACEGCGNVRFIQGDARRIGQLVDEGVALVLMANTLHGVPHRRGLCEAIRGVLEPGGRFIVINWHAIPRAQTRVFGQPRGPRDELRMSPEETRMVVEPAGFRERFVVSLGPFAYHYAAVFDAQTVHHSSRA